jgi:endogenous inhibitor of DNA gyrase (YacG/DUF329 family)
MNAKSERVVTKSGRVQSVKFYKATCPTCGKQVSRRLKHSAKYGEYCSSECRRSGLQMEYNHDRWYFDAYNDAMRELDEGGPVRGVVREVSPTSGRLRKNPSKKRSRHEG